MIEVFGIRHHGPGSARSLRVALERMAPDCVLIEGPPDADGIIPFVRGMTPPVALLLHVADNPRRAVYYPFAVYSPEWQALTFAVERQISVKFADLAMTYNFVLKTEEEFDEVEEYRPRDPLALLAEAAGYDDAERWWEHMVEERPIDEDIFAAILEGMSALRDAVGPPKSTRERTRERLREASMRHILRAAVKEGFQRIAFVCGAWHAPVVRVDFGPDGFSRGAAREDRELLKGLAKIKVASTWIPWTYQRLTYESGYGAGVESPGWYEHLWTSEHDVRISERWLVKVARLLRGEDLDASSAQVIDAARLADTLAAVRGRPLPGLAEMNEAAQAVFCLGNPLPLRLVAARLVVGDRLGTVPDDVPLVPLQRDMAQESKRLRLAMSVDEAFKELDLRKENDRDRSRLLHRLRLLGVSWGETRETSGLGTFKELWRLKWEPEFALRLIEMGRYGNTVEGAAVASAREQADEAGDLKALTGVLAQSFLSDLPAAAEHAMQRLQNEAAVATDLGLLMDALPPLARMLRYGTVRQTDAALLRHMVDGMLVRIFAGLAPACSALNDEAAEMMFSRIVETHRVVAMLQDEDDRAAWLSALSALANDPSLHGLIAGRVARLLMESGVWSADAVADRLSLSLSGDPQPAAAWVEGFLRESGLVLIHDDRLWGLLDGWLSGLDDDAFVQVLPLLRRTFSTFSAPERRTMGEQAQRGTTRVAVADDGAVDADAAARMRPVLTMLLGETAVDTWLT